MAALSRLSARLGSLVGVLFFYQMIRDAGSAARAFSDLIGWAPWLTVIRGLVMIVGGLRKA